MNDVLKHILVKIDVAVELYKNNPDVSEGRVIGMLKKCAIELLAELERQDLPEIKFD